MKLYQTKRPLHSEGNHQQNEKATYQMGKIFAHHISKKGLTFKIHKEYIQLSSKPKNTLIKNGQKI